MIARVNARGWIGPTGQLVADSVRFVTQLDGGQRIYVISTTTNELCVLIVEHPGVSAGSRRIGCGNPLSQVEPTTIASIRDSQQTPPLAFGVARDDVASVSFRAGGEEQEAFRWSTTYGYIRASRTSWAPSPFTSVTGRATTMSP